MASAVGLLLLVMISNSPISILADVQLPALFQDHMVLQQMTEIPVWGWANPGEKIHLEFADQQKNLEANDVGEWSTSLTPIPYGGPYQMTISAENEVVLKDILLGEVWLCSGQSNMDFTVSKAKDSEMEIAAADFPNIRLFSVKKAMTYDGPNSDCNGSWTVCSPESIKKFSAVAYYFGREIHEELDVPVGLIQASWGGTRVEAWTSRQALESHEAGESAIQKYEHELATFDPQQAARDYDERLEAWEKKKLRKPNVKKPKKKPSPAKNRNAPTGLFNAMINPTIPFAIQGVIWYQGEANSKTEQDAYQYRTLLSSMIQNWRQSWDQGDFPFYFVQLPAFASEKVYWPIIRESMSVVNSTIKNTGMAVTVDLDETKLHPKNKQDVGYRLALLALGDTYQRDIAFLGPEVKTVRLKGSEVLIRFKSFGDGLSTTQAELSGFELAGADGQYHSAQANVISSGFFKREQNQVSVTSPTVSNPVYVRYAWANAPVASLKNSAGLPAPPFQLEVHASGK
ncbi:MAG: sialate O-acetylesterase [FCB group bacterium]|nr:sialate O-acetylesterase [FCB group bacterium]MBL7120384.1 sialate O-acetylesterase [Candidatus Neomarinimicrobiota bacterium]